MRVSVCCGSPTGVLVDDATRTFSGDRPLAPVLDTPSRQTLDALMLAFPDR